LIKIRTFEVTSQYFANFISISSLVFENDKWTLGGAALGISICLISLNASKLNPSVADLGAFFNSRLHFKKVRKKSVRYSKA